MYPFERFTEEAKKVLTAAQKEAEASHHSYIGTEHMLLGILAVEGPGQSLLHQLGVKTEVVQQTIASVLGRNERTLINQLLPTSRVKKVIELAFQEARRRGDDHVGSDHMLLGLLLEGEGIAAHVLNDLGVSVQSVEAASGVAPRRPLVDGMDVAVGARILVHDEAPPYRLWEGTVAALDEGAVTVMVPGHPEGESRAIPRERLHTVPPRVWGRCAYCEFRA